ncbi:MAG: hypothetical protein IKR42_04890, partial [Campylobacter sp.]|nr:hypothetical protein [Campylobacter sp.]
MSKIKFMTLGELELIRIKTLKKINKSKKSISISTIFFMITNFIILVPYFVMNYFNEGTILGGGISIICIMSFVLYWSVIYEIEKENIFWIVEFV